MGIRLMLVCAFAFAMAWSQNAQADDLPTQLKSLLSGYTIMGTARISSEGTETFYVMNNTANNGTNDIFPLTCTTLIEGGWFCARGATYAVSPKPFKVPNN
jgi:hypothetical protein